MDVQEDQQPSDGTLMDQHRGGDAIDDVLDARNIDGEVDVLSARADAWGAYDAVLFTPDTTSPPANHCTNGRMDVGFESDVDCGDACVRCANGRRCETGLDCSSGDCSELTATCQAAASTLVATFASARFVRVTAGDFTGDRRPDIFAIADGNAVLFTNTGTAFTQTTVAPFAPVAMALAVGDLNNDGRLDVVVLDGNSQLTSFLNAGGSWTFSSTSIGTTVRETLLLQDIDGDRQLDAVCIDGLAVYWLRGSGMGTFTGVQRIRAPLDSVSHIAIADFDVDGDADLLIGSRTTDAVYYWRARRPSVFDGTDAVRLDASPSMGMIPGSTLPGPLALTVVPLDADSAPDFVSFRAGLPAMTEARNVFPGDRFQVSNSATNTQGYRTGRLVLPLLASRVYTAVGRFTRDSLVDVVLAPDQGPVSVLQRLILSTPSGIRPDFIVRTEITPRRAANSIASADFDGNGRDDIVISTEMAIDVVYR